MRFWTIFWQSMVSLLVLARFLRMDQGGEQWCSALIHGVAAQHGYD
jgi:hypothetical protein